MEFAEFIQTAKVDNVRLRKPFQPAVEGTLCVTGHHLILSSRRADSKGELWLLHSSIDSVEKRLSGPGGTLTLRCKDFSLYYLDIPSAEKCLHVASSVEQLSNIDNFALKYPFFYRSSFEIMEDGWQTFLPETEFTRFKECSEDWRLSYVNKDYSVCPSYPRAVIVPKSIDDEVLVRVAGFRYNGRFPVLSYYHRDSKSVMMRSSQPLTGPNGRRCKEDERLVNAVLGIGKRGYIIDTRSSNSAKLAQAKGGGFEPEAHYPQWRRIHHPIARGQVLHESLIKLIEACNESNASMDKWLSKLESSNWLSHIKDILYCSCVVAQCVDKEGASVLVHGSEGTDSTLQITSLSQLILDHDCRTFRGFEALVEREWLQGGHPFEVRCSKSAFAVTKHRQESPVFLMFLDCVWQIWQQFPCSFEFNEDFLIILFQHAYSSRFALLSLGGLLSAEALSMRPSLIISRLEKTNEPSTPRLSNGTFLGNNEFERKQHRLTAKTVSLWSFLNRPEVIQEYLNPMYDPNPSVIWPSVAPQSLTLWSGLYQRYQIDLSPQKEAWTEIVKIREHDKELRSKVAKLRRQLAALEKEAVTANVILPEGLEPKDANSP